MSNNGFDFPSSSSGLSEPQLNPLWVETAWNRRIYFIEKNLFPTSSGANEWAKWSVRANRAVHSKQMSEQTSEWPSTLRVYSLITQRTVEPVCLLLPLMIRGEIKSFMKNHPLVKQFSGNVEESDLSFHDRNSFLLSLQRIDFFSIQRTVYFSALIYSHIKWKIEYKTENQMGNEK